MKEVFEMKNKIIIGMLIIGLVFIVGCGQTLTPIVESEVQPTGEVKEFDIIAKNWEFTPSTIEVNLGDKVELHVESIEGTHGFALSEFGINERLSPGEDVHINFIANKKGTFGFYCSVPCGSGHGGMRGQLIVN